MDTSTERRADAPAVEPDRRSHRALWLTLAGLTAVVILDLVLVGLSSQEVRRHLESGRDALRSGNRALRDGDTELATAVFAEAGDEFRAAAGETRTPWYALASWAPVLGRTPDTVRAISDAGVDTADAAAVIAQALNQVPGGVGGLAPRFGAIPLEPLDGLAAAVEQAAELTHRALERLEASSDAFVLGSVAEARQDALEAIRPLDRQLRAGALILRGLPGLLGQDEPKRYYFGAANPAEERGTGGLIGAFSILTVDDGRLSFSGFQPVQSLPELPAGTWPSPSAQYVENAAYYWTNDDFWLNTNLTPDFPLAAGTIAMSYEAAVGGPLDGVIVADPFALEALMRVTGPVSIRSVGVRIEPSQIVRFVSNEAYALFDTDDERKAVLGNVAADVLAAFLLLPGDDLAKQRALLRAFGGGHVKVWTADPTTQEGLALTTVGGAFRPEGTDAIALITNSASGTKLDFYQRRTVSYDVSLAPGGSGTASLTASLENDSPTSGFPPYVIGPFEGRTREPGDNIAVVHVYCDEGCILSSAIRNDRPVELAHFEQDGRPYFEDYVRTAAGDTSTLQTELFLPRAWTGDSSGGTYRLSFEHQITIQPSILRVRVALPAGMHVTSMSDGLQLEGSTVVYEGTPGGDLDLEVSFAPPLPVRVWRDLTRPF